MEEKSRFATGIDIGTKNVRVVQGSLGRDGQFTIIGYGESPSSGMRRGAISEMRGPNESVDLCLRTVESMSGSTVTNATLSINGKSVCSTKADGMITILPDHEISEDDIARLQQVAIDGKKLYSRQILDVIPFEYVLDEQRGIREPLGMRGSRLDIRANIISVLMPEYENLQGLLQDSEMPVVVNTAVPSVIAAAEAVLTGKQRENGVGVVDFGDSTTSLAIYDEGELQYLAVIPLGSNDITKDLSMMLMTVPEVAEEVKVRFVNGRFGESTKDITIKHGRENEYVFSRSEVEETVEARLEEIFGRVREHLKAAGYDRRLPEGLILTGGGAKMRDIDAYVRNQVELAVRIGKPGNRIANPSEEFCRPEYAAAVGLMMRDAMFSDDTTVQPRKHKQQKKSSGGGLFGKIFNSFK